MNDYQFRVRVEVFATPIFPPMSALEKMKNNQFNVWLNAKADFLAREMERSLRASAWNQYKRGV